MSYSSGPPVGGIPQILMTVGNRFRLLVPKHNFQFDVNKSYSNQPDWSPCTLRKAKFSRIVCSYLERLDAGKETLCLEVGEDEEGVGVVRHLVAHAAAAHAVPLAEVPQEHHQGADARVEFLQVYPLCSLGEFCFIFTCGEAVNGWV